MKSFSQAIANGINVMDLPDAPAQKEDDGVSEEIATMVYSESVNDKTQLEAAKQSKDRKKQVLEDQIAKIIDNFNTDTQSMQKKQEDEPTQVMMEAQAAIEDVQVVIPNGMSIRNHKKLTTSDEEVKKQQAQFDELGKDSDKIIKNIQEQQEIEKTEKELGINQESTDNMNEIQKQTQNALEQVTVVTDGKQEAKEESKQDQQNLQIEEKQESKQEDAEETPQPKKAELNEA